jgi:DnaJ-class molecular chaperone
MQCPECKGRGDVPFYTYEGDKEWDTCGLCRGEKEIPVKKKLAVEYTWRTPLS